MSLSNYGENAVLGLVQGAATFWLALFTTVPGEGGTGTEVSGGGYARQSVTFGAPSGGSMANSLPIEVPTATSDWGTASGWALFDAKSGGNMWWSGAVDVPKDARRMRTMEIMGSEDADHLSDDQLDLMEDPFHE